MKNKEKKEKKKYGFLVIVFAVTAFLASFSVSAYFFMNSENLIFSENENELKRLTALLGERDSRIADLEYELQRYKALYEEELKNNPPMEIIN